MDLIDRFLRQSVSALGFQRTYLRMVKNERRILGEPVSPILQELFEDADAYIADERLRTEPEDLDDEVLISCAARARRALRDLGYT
ncbi:colicin immunity domain-containing protein [Mycobacterium kyogaense]|uniref:colicin immunity domain-containing protein n=1 Tax=Mycobacterium kyogaense TaxID=2212479 RepID=UPI000DAC5555|nr:colicin immunity domain-containing protein [Mycobacterium kyogaense]